MASTAVAAQSQRASPSQAPSAAAVAAARPKSTTNGVNNPPSQKLPTSSIPQEANASNQHAHDRLLFLVANFIGSTASVTTVSGDRFTGVFSTPSLEPPELKYALKMTKQLSQSNEQDGGSYVGVGEDRLMLFDVKDVVDLAVANVALDKVQLKTSNGASTGFRTDTDISGNASRAERELTPWEPSAASNLNNVTFSNAGRAWDQFEANERLYGVKTDYNENIYTTKIDTEDPSYRTRLANADRLAREIENTATSNIHLAEERGLVDEANRDVDEEERYSGVRRDLNPSARTNNTYTPPARRAPTTQPTVSGAPVDPAIISSQLARPDAQTRDTQSKDAVSPPKTSDGAAKKENAPPAPHAATNASRTAALDKAALDRPGQNGHLRSTITPAPTANNTKEWPSNGANATQNVERDVLKSFKDFSANEKLRMQERQRAAARKEKDVKLNDLKHWGMNFKLKNEVPPDMLGILAKDKQKQAEILEKAKRQALEKQQAEALKTSPASTGHTQISSTDSPASTSTAPSSRQAAKSGGRPAQSTRTFQAQNVPSMPPPRQPQTGNLGQRLQAHMQQQQQQQQQQQPRAPPSGPAALDTSSTRGGSQTPSSAVSAKFNPAAFEFRPNPAATSFSPTSQARVPVTASPAKSGVAPASKPVSFFGDKRPTGPRKNIRDAFNPIRRMKKEAEKAEENKKKAWAANGGIPFAYDTNPRWTVTRENEEKKMSDCFSKQITQFTGPPPPVNGAMPYADQLPPHVQQTSGLPQIHMPPQGPQQFQQFGHHRGNDHQFDGQRMHVPSYSSPRVQPQMMMHPSPMMGHVQPFGQPIQQFPMGGQPMFMRTPSQQFQGQHMATPMMQNHSGGAPYMGMPTPQGMQMYPQQFQFVPAQGPGASGAYGSPRGAPMMVQQGSQQGQAPQFMIQGQPGQQVYVQQHPQQMMRPGMAQQQPSFGSPHMMGQHFPAQPHRGNSFNSNASFNGNQFSQPQTPQMGQAVQPNQQQAPATTSGPASIQEESK